MYRLEKAVIPDDCLPLSQSSNTVICSGASYHLGEVVVSKDGSKYIKYYVPNTTTTGSLDANGSYVFYGELTYFTV